MTRPSRILLGAAGGLAAVALGVGSLAGPPSAETTSGLSLRSAVCSDAVAAGSSQISLLSDAVPADIGVRMCRLADAFGGSLGDAVGARG